MGGHTVDLVVVGAGIVGLAAAYAASQRGLRVAVVERHPCCIGASVRNFGLVTVTGQPPGIHWQRAWRSREIWEQVAPQAGIAVLQRGLHVLARRPEAAALLDAFLRTEMARDCRWLGAAEAAQALPMLRPGQGVLYSPHELRVESRDAIPRLARWLEHSRGVVFHWDTPVLDIDLPMIRTSRGLLHAGHCVVSPGHDLRTLYPDSIERAGVGVCTLQMMRLMPEQPFRLPTALMSDLSLVRYEGFTHLPEAAALQAALATQQPEHLRWGVHLIVVQSDDGSLVVGDSHTYDRVEGLLGRSEVDGLILSELQEVLRWDGGSVVERWNGSYAAASDVVFKESPVPGVALGIVTGGTGASTAFAFAEELVDMALGEGA